MYSMYLFIEIKPKSKNLSNHFDPLRVIENGQSELILIYTYSENFPKPWFLILLSNLELI